MTKTERLSLYPFQARAVNRTVSHLAAGARACLVSPTGSGKTVMAAEIIRRGGYRRPLALAHTTALVEQLTETLCPAVTVQQLCSTGWPSSRPWPDLIVWDECHHSASAEWGLLGRFFEGLPMVGLTATPARPDGLALDAFSELVVAAQYSELLELGLLVPARVLGPSELEAGARPDPVQAYRDYADGTRAFFFCASIEQADEVAARLGKTAASWHSQMPWGYRRQLLNDFRVGKLTQLTTVDALTEGVDVPEAETLVSSRTFGSLTGWLQACGRVLRAAPGKKHATIVDLLSSSVTQGHGSPTEDRVYSIQGAGIRRGLARPPRAWPAAAWEPRTLPEYHASLSVLFDVPSRSDYARYKARLADLARRQGATKETASRAYSILFGDQHGEHLRQTQRQGPDHAEAGQNI